MGPRKTVRGLRSRDARRAERSAAGPLETLVVAPKTLKRYKTACHRFSQSLHQQQLLLPESDGALDLVIAEYFECLWQEGEPLQYGTDVLSGLQYHLPALKRYLPCS